MVGVLSDHYYSAGVTCEAHRLHNSFRRASRFDCYVSSASRSVFPYPI